MCWWYNEGPVKCTFPIYFRAGVDILRLYILPYPEIRPILDEFSCIVPRFRRTSLWSKNRLEYEPNNDSHMYATSA